MVHHTSIGHCWRSSLWRGVKLGWHLLWSDLHIVCARLGGQHTFGFIAMAFTLAVLFVGILNDNFLVHEELAVHVGHCFIGGLEVREGHEAVAF